MRPRLPASISTRHSQRSLIEPAFPFPSSARERGLHAMNNVDDPCQIEVVDHLRESLSAHEKCARRSVRWVKLVGVLNLGNYYLPHTLWCSVDGFLFGNIPERCILSMMAFVQQENTANLRKKSIQSSAGHSRSRSPEYWPRVLVSALLPILNSARTCTPCTMGATKNPPVRFYAMADHLAAAMRTTGRKRVNCTLERIEGVGFALGDDLERLVIIISAGFANRHNLSFAFEEIRAPTRNCAYLQKAVQTGANQKQAEWSMPWPWRWRFDR
jgi:hypothetical protein